eukprot:6481890-Amphidinium_carterae.4
MTSRGDTVFAAQLLPKEASTNNGSTPTIPHPATWHYLELVTTISKQHPDSTSVVDGEPHAHQRFGWATHHSTIPIDQIAQSLHHRHPDFCFRLRCRNAVPHMSSQGPKAATMRSHRSAGNQSWVTLTNLHDIQVVYVYLPNLGAC